MAADNPIAVKSAPDAERFVPTDLLGIIALEHWHRYLFAAQFTKRKIVLDLACGDGYGSHYLAAGASRVYGIDISGPTIAVARDKYTRPNLEFLVGNCTDIPLPNHAVDVVVSFETIEHLAEHDRMLSEIKRVLKPTGVLIISTPEKGEHAVAPEGGNPYHVKELYREEFQALLDGHFRHVRLLGQQVMFGSVIVPQKDKVSVNRYVMKSEEAPETASLEPAYWIALASDRKLPEASAGILDDMKMRSEASRNRGRNRALSELIRVVAMPESKVLGRALRDHWYRSNSADVVAQGVDPEIHWYQYGCAEGRLPTRNVAALVENLVAERIQHQYARLCDALEAGKAQQGELIATWREREGSFTQRLRDMADELLATQRDAEKSSRSLGNENARLRLRARYEAEALMRSEAAKARKLLEQFHSQLEASRAEKDCELEAERASSKRLLDALTEELRSREANWQGLIEEAGTVQAQLRQRLEASRADMDRALEAERASSKRLLDELIEELRSREAAWQRQLEEARDVQDRLRAQLESARERESASLHLLREQDRQFGQQMLSWRTEADSAREMDRRRADQVLEAATARAQAREQEVLAQFVSQMEVARAEAARARETDRELLQNQLRLQSEWFREKEAQRAQASDALRRRVIEMESSWVWRLRSLFLPDRPGMALLNADVESVRKETSGGLTDIGAAPSQEATRLPESLSELLQYEDREFIEAAYMVILGRAADATGLGHYLDNLRNGTDKMQIVCSLHTSPEGRAHETCLVGLHPAMSRYRWRRLPLVAYYWRRRDLRRNLLHQLKLARLEAADLRIQRFASDAALQKFIDFDPQSYLSINRDVARAQVNPFEHYVRFGYREHRKTRVPKAPGQVSLPCDWLLTNNSLRVIADAPVIDIVIPVFNGYEFLGPLFESLGSNTRSPFRLIVVDDCSTDERIAALLSFHASRIPGTLLLANSTNLGFIGSVNRAMQEVKSELLVLLNSDTEVPPGWLERLILPLQRDASIASVTPFSNAATICSFPVALEDNPLYLGLSAAQIDRAFDECGSAAQPIDIPTGVGFCMAMRKSVIDQIGGFDPIFGRGYGEENDWCMRASARGYRHVLAPNVFVYHKHGGSFASDEKVRLIENNMRVLKTRYPEYQELVETHARADPGKALREFIKLRLFAEVTGGATVVIDHGLGGGANAFRREMVESVVGLGKTAIVLIADARHGEQFQMIACGSEGETRFALSSGELLVQCLQLIRVAEVVYNNLVGAADALALIRRLSTLIQARSWPLRIMMHDYYPICPSYTLIDQTGSYCGVPDRLETCERCIREMPPRLLPYRPQNLDMRAWRAEWQDFMQLSVEIRCFSDSSREIFARAYPLLADRCSVVPHAVRFKPGRLPVVRSAAELHIGIVGGINYSKGRGVLESLIRYIEENNLGHKLSVVGETDIPVPGVHVTGRYELDQLPDIIENLGINVILIPSIWPETFSYVASETMALGLPVACFNLGAPAERVRNYARGVVLDDRDPESILRRLSLVISPPSAATV